MTTVHHPPLKGLGAQHSPNWLWIGLSVVTVILVMIAIAWTISSPSVTETPTGGTAVATEMDHEMTAAQFAAPGVTTDYFGDPGLLNVDH